MSYAKAGARGSVLLVMLLLIGLVLSEALFIFLSVYLSSQIRDSTPEQPTASPTSEFMLVYSMLGVGVFLLWVVVSLFFAWFHTNAAQAVFERASRHLFRLPMSFYWREPVGEVLSLFSADQHILQSHLISSFHFFDRITRCLTLVIVIVIRVPLVVLGVIPYFGAFLLMNNAYQRASFQVCTVLVLLCAF
jgi:ABC-type multidrug transport system fused ATPase/permease subunit